MTPGPRPLSVTNDACFSYLIKLVDSWVRRRCYTWLPSYFVLLAERRRFSLAVHHSFSEKTKQNQDKTRKRLHIVLESPSSLPSPPTCFLYLYLPLTPSNLGLPGLGAERTLLNSVTPDLGGSRTYTTCTANKSTPDYL